jgi:endonuclease/exonuclease/phosphatase family metal-dependent hydrolase
VPVPVGYDEQARAPGLDTLLRRIEATARPLVMLGDLNTGDRQPFYRVLRARLSDAYRASGEGFGFTFPNREVTGWPIPPLVGVDYIFNDSAFVAVAAWTGQLPGSDHRYVVADLALLP